MSIRAKTMRSGIVGANGARLYHEVRGSGPTVLGIHGGADDAGLLAPLAEALADRFTVITYDGRGRSRSPSPNGRVATSVQQQADDAVALLEALGAAPAAVFGTSSGGVVLLDLVARHPSCLRCALVHEPPIVGVLPNAAELGAQLKALVEQGYARGGPRAALETFVRTMAGDATYEAFAAADPARLERLLGNAEWFFEIDMPAVVSYVPDARALSSSRVSVIPLAGAESRGQFLYETTRWVAGQVGADVVELPGGHAGFVEHPAEAAAIIRSIVEGCA